ncbi:ArsR/SmtB family transcription factor [Halobaculum marinum]|uniref:ArsR/SmtB family transcription factor n=1 Tax=Halobaculum marinum TaxID=3031996 RepID=A0ABD5WRX4_9EURY|nr:helix-turn-helix domain-containing protein [Halobaculum sp. DT55]
MSSVFERLAGTVASNERPRVIDVDDTESDEVLDALAAETRRGLLRSTFDRPGTASALAERVDTSVQNAHYHLKTLEEAGLVEPAGVSYSEKGNEMTVYAPACDPLVFVGDAERRRPVREAVLDAVGGVGLVSLGGLAVAWGLETLDGGGVERAVAVGSAGVGDGAVGSPVGIDVAAVFVVGCVVVAIVVAVLSRC